MARLYYDALQICFTPGAQARAGVLSRQIVVKARAVTLLQCIHLNNSAGGLGRTNEARQIPSIDPAYMCKHEAILRAYSFSCLLQKSHIYYQWKDPALVIFALLVEQLSLPAIFTQEWTA